MFGLRIGGMGRVGSALTLTQQAINILRRPGLESHVYMPGVGWASGLSLTNAIMEDGTQAASVDNPVGYMGDAASTTLGAELNPQPEFNAQGAWALQQPTSGSVTISGGRLRINSADGSNCSATLAGVLSAGKAYEFTMTVVSYVSGTGGISLDGGTTNNFVINANGTFTFRLIGAAAASIIIKRFSACDFSIESLSVRELVGAIPARQATTANKPILRRGAVNRLLWSQQFDNAWWTNKVRSSIVVSSDAAPDSTNTAQRIVEDSTASTSHYLRKTSAFTAGPIQSLSVYAKAGTRSWIGLSTNWGGGGTQAEAYFDIANGVVGTTLNATASITNVGGGWFRCSVTQTGTPSSDNYFDIGLASGNGGKSYTGNGTGYAIIWGAQLETGSTASPYIPTTTAPASSPTGPYWAEYDGTDFMSLASVPFGINDDFCVVAAAVCNTNTNARVFALHGTTAQMRLYWDFTTTKYVAAFTNDAGASVFVADPGSGFALGAMAVLGLRQVGSNKVLRRNGVSGTPVTSAVGTATATGAQIGAQNGTAFFTGNLYTVIAIKGTITDAELATLERWVAAASGVTL